ncbi:LysM peptidoglycan-binding domain-containing protein [Patescibacteria group bacterium]
MKKMLKTLKMNESAISQAFGALVVVVIGVLLFNYFKTNQVAPEISEEAEHTIAINEDVELTTDEEGKFVPKGLPTTHTVAKGDHLWSISEKYFGNGYNWVDIADENNLTDPGMIEEGMELTVPEASLRYDKDVQKTAKKEDSDLLSSTSYTVTKGDHLWKIALGAYGDGYRWADIYNANSDKISHPNYIETGMELIIPR